MIPTPADVALLLSQSVEASLVIKATALLLLGLTAVALAGRTRASVRHLILAATFASIAAIPLLVNSVPETRITIPIAPVAASVSSPVRQAARDTTATAAPLRPAASTFTISPRSVFQVLWFAGALLFLAPVAATLWKLRTLRRRALPFTQLSAVVESMARDTGMRRRIEVLQHEEVVSPMTFGAWRPTILMPSSTAGWTEPDLRRALTHEIEHIRRADWIVHLAARTIASVYWFHPLAWMAWRRLVLDAERACDDAVVARDERTDYAEQLVTLAQTLTASSGPALGMAHRSDLAARVSALLDDTRPRGRAGIATATLTIGGAVVMALGLAPLRAVAVTREPAGTIANQPSPLLTEKQLVSIVPRRLRALDRELVEAAQNGDLEDVKDLIEAGASVDAEVQGDGSPLIAAARANRLPVVLELLNRGADVNLAVLGDGNPLIAAAAAGAEKIVDLLLSRGAAIDLMVPGDENALIQAAGNGHFAIVKMLVDRGADVNARVWADRSAFAKATARQVGSSDDRLGGEWRTPLGEARKEQHQTIVAYLLQAGARE
jgi:bla regulator protein blaR1